MSFKARDGSFVLFLSCCSLINRFAGLCQYRQLSDGDSNVERIDNDCVTAINRPYQMDMSFDQPEAAC
jgi:hypothetical protein